MIRLSVCLAMLSLCAGCGGEDSPSTRPKPSGGVGAEQPQGPQGPDPAPRLEPARCPAGLAGCEEASGRIAYVERVDPDGDGDAHFVLLDAEGISGPGITVVDVRRDLRPHPLPGPGDELSAAGPVYPGSYGQRQIEAVAVSVAG